MAVGIDHLPATHPLSAHNSQPPRQASIIVCTFRRDQVLVDTLRQLAAQISANQHQILVIDQQPDHPPHIQEALQELVASRSIELINLEVPGLTHARNVGADAAIHEILIFCDDDIVPGPGLITEHLACYTTPAVAAVAGQVLELGESPHHRPGHFAHDTFTSDFHGLYGANFSIRKSIYHKVGGSDESLGVHAYTEDVVLAHRLKSNKHQIVFQPRASVRHLKTSRGGCRITDNSQPTAEWEKSFSKLYWLFLSPDLSHEDRRRTWREALRHGPLRRENITSPWRQPAAWLAFAQAVRRARRAALAAAAQPKI